MSEPGAASAVLPVAQRSDEIARAIAAHQVIVLCGETGSGKTTQLPQICLRAGRGANLLIGHTQPRRLAARSVAARLAVETATKPGTLVAYKIRFSDQTGPDCRVKIMTDGILLQELRRDRQLSQYDTLIIDEAHERSVNIDFLLGYLKRLLPRRPDLHVVIMSATIDPKRFSKHFDDAPIIEVSGRSYPVEVRYRPPAEDSDDVTALLDAVAELNREPVAGDILTFLPGERDIRDAAQSLRKRFGPSLEVLPLFARLAAHEQDRIFSPGKKQRVILATNVAETSITVPRIAAVIDTGLARISRYSHQSKIQRLPIEGVSQASAQQRAGRCGRVSDGICLRLYSEEDFNEREAFTDPEILRTNLAGVLLRMADLKLGDIENFPFPDPPDVRLVRDGRRLLSELQAIGEDGNLTRIGRTMARLPVDPRFGRMLIAAGRNGSVRELLVIVAALSIIDPAESRDVDHTDTDDDWRHPRSEFIAYLQLWELFHRRQKELGGSQLRKWCRRHGLNFLRLREWQDVHRQLRQQSHELKLRPSKEPAKYRPIHDAVLSGLLSQIGEHHEGPDYHGARQINFRLVPNVTVSSNPKWLVAATIRQTHRAYASQVAGVQPGWIEQTGRHLVRRRYSDPYWDRSRQRVLASESVSLYGLTLRANRRVDYTDIDPVAATRVFIHDGLGRGDYNGAGEYRQHNERVAADLIERSARLRRTDLLPDAQRQAAFFRDLVPSKCPSPRVFEQWRKAAERDDPKLLHMTPSDMSAAAELAFDPSDYPNKLAFGGNDYVLQYRFSPIEADDGISLVTPVAAIGELDQGRLDWLVPGLLPEKVVTILRGLPKALRRKLVPAPERAQDFLASFADTSRPFYSVLSEYLTRAAGKPVSTAMCAAAALPDYLHLRIVAIDDDGNTVAAARNLDQLREALGVRLHAALALNEAGQWHREGLTEWALETLPRFVTVRRQGVTIEAAPGLEDHGNSVTLRLFETVDQAQRASRRGISRLLALRFPQQARMISKQLDTQNMKLLSRTAGGLDVLADELVMITIDDLSAGRLPRESDAFAELANAIRTDLVPHGEKLARVLTQTLERHHAIRTRLESVAGPARADIASQLDHLVFPGFVSLATAEWLVHFPRYLTAIERRINAVEEGKFARDQRLARDVEAYWRRWCELENELGVNAMLLPAGRTLRFMIEEYRVSLFAQPLGTSRRVSPRRLDDLFAATHN